LTEENGKSEDAKQEENPNVLTQEIDIDNYINIWKWSCKLAREEEVNEGFFFLQASWLSILFRLQKTQGNLIKVVGGQGVGKTTFAHWLDSRLRSGNTNALTVQFKRMEKGYEQFGHFEKIPYYEKIEASKDKTHEVLITDKDWNWDISDACKNLIVDMWDYSKNSQREITKSLDSIQSFWAARCAYRARDLKQNKRPEAPAEIPNIVVFLQKEAMPLHFFLGKMQLFELELWSPEELLADYQAAFGDTKPFSQDALYELAVLSRGVFRRFKEYISATLDPYFAPGTWGTKFTGEITKGDVQKTISTHRLVRDMELQLSELWPGSKVNRELSVRLLRFLRDKGPTLQNEIANEFFPDNPMACSRMLSTLAPYGHVKPEQTGQQKRWEVVA
jgi:hypothetical protein